MSEQAAPRAAKSAERIEGAIIGAGDMLAVGWVDVVLVMAVTYVARE